MKSPNLPTLITEIPEFSSLLSQADYVDVKTIEGAVSFRQFIANFISYMPLWMQALYAVRLVFVRFLGMRQKGIPSAPNLKPDEISFTPGDKLTFFKVEHGDPQRFIIASASESHLAAYLGIVVEPLTPTRNRFYIITIVHYHRWTGPVYFNVIRPFHHIVVGKMAQAGVAVG